MRMIDRMTTAYAVETLSSHRSSTGHGGRDYELSFSFFFFYFLLNLLVHL